MVIFLAAGCTVNTFPAKDVCGVYHGILPAADGPGIDTTIILKPDNTFTKRMVYIGEQNGTFNETGTFSINGRVITLNGCNDGAQYYQLGEGLIRQLDQDKQVVTGVLADNYVLMKTSSVCSRS